MRVRPFKAAVGAWLFACLLTACGRTSPNCELELEVLVLEVFKASSDILLSKGDPDPSVLEQRQALSRQLASTYMACPTAKQTGIMVRDIEKQQYWTPLELALLTLDSELVSHALSSRGDWVQMHQQDEEPYHGGPLHIAAQHSDSNAIRMLVDYGFDPDGVDGNGDPVLISAINKWRSAENIRALIELGADPRRHSVDRPEPLGMAVTLRDLEAVNELISAGALDGLPVEDVTSLTQHAIDIGATDIAAAISRQLAPNSGVP